MLFGIIQSCILVTRLMARCEYRYTTIDEKILSGYVIIADAEFEIFIALLYVVPD